MRIHIIGGAGSGKSYIAERLSKALNIPHFDLDDVFWDKDANNYGVKTPLALRDKKLKVIVDQPAWIIDGVYLKWVTPSFQLADKIFILNTPIEIQEERIWKRYKDRKEGIIPSSKKESIESVMELIKWNKRYNQELLPNFIKNSDYSEKIVHVENYENILGICSLKGIELKE
ncbi:DNA topology modulation protein FlaR [Ornithinibacillus scapharcae]|uniref:DNA topology modulation protein FlaR n=1 Tax=Ornithinibacillus scapharcae TaxID=1147159 RepID=UPI000225B5A8|nr:DNA topology modulation protein FlaR [Ornithinibacillus scapharcae]